VTAGYLTGDRERGIGDLGQRAQTPAHPHRTGGTGEHQRDRADQ